MTVRNLDMIFKPKRVAVIGASERTDSVGYTVLRNMITAGYDGVVYPVNPKREAIHGIQAYPDVASLPRTPDLAVICIPAKFIPSVVRECGEAGILGLLIISAGFREVGEDGKALEAEILAEQKKYPGMRIVGPNCLGVIVPSLGVNASFAAATPKAGHVAFLSQSGALCTSVLDWAIKEDIGFSHFVSIGNALDVSIGDLIDYFGQDAETSSIILYAESVTDARQFMSAGRAFARTKPIVAYKAGRFAESAKAAASHTGAMAAEDDVYDAAMQRAGIVRVFEVGDMFECAELLARGRIPTGPHLAIITNAGGPGVMATDTLVERHGVLATLSDETMEKLNAVLPPFWSHNNPVDILGDAPAARYAEAAEIVLADKAVNAALVVLTPQSMTDPTATAEAVAAIARKSRKPVLAAWMGADAVAEGIQVFNQAGIPTYTSPERAVAAFMYLVSYSRNIDVLYDTPREMPVSFALDRDKLRDIFDTVLLSAGETLSESFSKAMLDAYEIPTTRPRSAHSADEAVQAARRVGHPVVLKILSPQITHKTDVGGVVLNLRDDAEVRAAYQRIVDDAATHRPDATIEGVTVQKMIDTKAGFELILGAKKDPVFGAVIMVGSGGVTAELYGDRTLGLPPLTERLARRMLESLTCWPILEGYRGKPPMNIDKLIEILLRLSYLVADYPEIEELDINPLLVTPDEVTALDARVIINRELAEKPVRPYAHLAIRPYPEQYIRDAKMRDGTPIVLRPIKPEDEPMWHELLASCSPESIRSRFSYLFTDTSHDMAARYCFIDYDREIGIVAELETRDDDRRLIGVGRLVADPDHDTAEYAILIADEWQNQGVGRLLTAYCVEIADSWHIKRVTAVTSSTNSRMVKIFTELGFQVSRDDEDDLVVVEKVLA
ncbi:MAG: GNAT family N-acetyltransferase [Phycisphaerales bacterium]|nr:GNAT family N-acetyltransferase [Phycisphaerales bacterium]